MKPKFSEKFNQLLERAKADNNIVGLFLVGSRGKGFENEHSDYDIKIITNDEVAEAYNKEFVNLIRIIASEESYNAYLRTKNDSKSKKSRR